MKKLPCYTGRNLYIADKDQMIVLMHPFYNWFHKKETGQRKHLTSKQTHIRKLGFLNKILHILQHCASHYNTKSNTGDYNNINLLRNRG